MKESELIRDAIKELLIRGIPAWRNQSGSIKTAWGTWIDMAPKGSSDIVGCLPPTGQFFAAEAKTGRRKATPEQKKFIKVIQEAGGRAFVFRSVQELLKEVRK